MLPRPILTQLAPLRSLTARHLRPAPSSPSSIVVRRAWGKFYATFGRPIFKTILISIFTYQLAYYFWVRLENNEIKDEMNEESPRLTRTGTRPSIRDRSNDIETRSENRTAREGAAIMTGDLSITRLSGI
ncbi:hypothetical protein F4810DRAFT_709652 [Camillea tinctor]|nr:hypothetical protein F4810DRAFT_709652 [Camillea tinctor]